MGRRKGGSKYKPLLDAESETHSKRNEVKTTNNESSMTDMKSNRSEDKFECKESLIEGNRIDDDDDHCKTDKNKSNSNEKIPIKKSASLDRQSNEKSQNRPKKINKPLNDKVHKGSDETSSPNVKNMGNKNVSSRNEQYKQNNQVEDNTEVKVSGTERNVSNKICHEISKLVSTEFQQSEDIGREPRIKQNNVKIKNSKKIHNKSEETQSIDDKRRSETTNTRSTNRSTRMEQNCGNHDQNYFQSKKQDKKCKNKRRNDNMDRFIVHQQSSTDNDEKCVIEEIDKNLFELSNEYALAHCVAEDLRMGAGIAVEFKRKFGGVGKLIDQNLRIGDVGIVCRHGYNVFYLITKRNSSGKPTMITLEKALRSLLIKMKEMNLTKLGIPTIGCGLDGLDWDDVKYLIYQIFAGSGIHISVCIPSKLLDRKAPYQISVNVSQKNLWEMEAQTDCIIFIDFLEVKKKIWTDYVVDKVNDRYPFKENLLNDLNNEKIKPGDIKPYTVKNEIIICVFYNPHAYYSSIEDAFFKIRDLNKSYRYLAMQNSSIEANDNFKRISWIVLILRSVMKSCELWLCGCDADLPYDQYCKNKRYSSDNSFKYNSSKHYDESRSNDSRERNQYQMSSSWTKSKREENSLFGKEK